MGKSLFRWFQDQSISRKLTYPLIPLGTLLIALMVWYIFSELRSNFALGAATLVRAKSEALSKQIEAETQTALLLAARYATEPRVVQAYLGLRTDTVQSLAMLHAVLDQNQSQLADYGLRKPNIHFHLPPAISLLRSWTDKRGDDVSAFRQSILKVAHTRRAVQGIEIGRAGFVLRGIAPIFGPDSSYLGSVECLVPIDKLAEALGQSANEDFGIYIPQHYGRILSVLLGGKSNELPRNGNYLLGQATTDFQGQLLPPSLLDSAWHTAQQHIVGPYLYASLPIRNFEGQQEGIGIVQLNIAHFRNQLLMSALRQALLALGLLVGMLLFIRFMLRRAVLRRLDSVEAALTQISQGQLIDPQPVECDDELSSMKRALNRLRSSFVERAQLAQAIGEGQYESPFEPLGPTDILGNALLRMRAELQRYALHMERLVAERTNELAASEEELRQNHEELAAINESLHQQQALIEEQNASLRESQARLAEFSMAVEQSGNSIVMTDLGGRITYVNPRFTELTGYSAMEVVGRTPRILKSGEMPPEVYTDMWKTIASGNTWSGEFHNRRKDGSLYWELANIAPVYNQQNTISGYIAIKEDITERRQREQDAQAMNMALNEANLNLEDSLRQLSEQSVQLQQWNDRVRESLQYAKRIQQALLPSDDALRAAFREHFVWYQPREIVGGDFYWIKQTPERTYLCVADSTGHGVPGGFMSMLGITLLNQITRDESLDAAQILDRMRQAVKVSLRQEHHQRSQTDGIELALVVLHTPSLRLEYAGAHNPALLLRAQGTWPNCPGARSYEGANAQLLHIGADPMPIAIYPKERPFTLRKVQLQPGDRVFLFTDGITDQFLAGTDSKITIRRLRQHLLDSAHLTLPQHREHTEAAFRNWCQGHQVDDVLMLGFEV